MHALFPRYYEFQHDNTTYIEGVAIWSLIKKKTRKIIFAEDYGLSLPREKTGRELPFPLQISCPKFKKTATLLANWSNCDLNGHLNNAYYLDFVEGLIPISFLKKNEPKLLEIEYIKEIKLGEAVLVTYGKKDKDYYFLDWIEDYCTTHRPTTSA
jgi:acyl-ACP thioesterase